MNSFLLNPGTRLVLNNGKVDVTYNKPEWREGLKYLNQLHQEGLLDPNSFTQDNDQLLRLGQSDPPIVGAMPGGHTLYLSPAKDEEGARWSQYVTVPPIKGEWLQCPGFKSLCAVRRGTVHYYERCKEPRDRTAMGRRILPARGRTECLLGTEGRWLALG
jgi:putative aldouronate transport system substrate-binding protein